MNKSIWFLFVTLLMLPLTAQANLYDFHLIGDDNSPSNDVGPQLLMEVTEGSTSGIDFTFLNIGDIDSFIADIYFDATPDDAINYASYSFSEIGQVAFSIDATPGNLPGGNTISFSSDWDADSDSPVAKMGIDNYATGDTGGPESLTINFAYTANQTFEDVISLINSGDLLVGLHVQGIAPNDKSEAYVNNIVPVPEPTTTALVFFGLGIAGLTAIGKRRK